jgi:carbamoyl-phosphate synthase / aspartate carbamoyltransferase
MTKIDKWFLSKLKGLSEFGKMMSTSNAGTTSISLSKQAKQTSKNQSERKHVSGRQVK